MKGIVAVVGSPHDPHVARVVERVREECMDATVVDGTAFPDDLWITLGERLNDITVGERRLDDISAVYYRDIYAHPLSYGVDAHAEMEQDWRRTLVAYQEKANLLLGLLARWTRSGVPVYNPRTTEWLQPKPVQLSVLEAAGLPVPQTVWTNDPEAVKSFAEGRRVVYKPVVGGAATRELGPEDLTPERLRKLAGAPVTFQELLPGDNYRVYCIDGEIVAGFHIVAEEIDFRQNEESIERWHVPEVIAEQCIRAVAALGFRWGGIDLRADENGELHFLEVNSSPMFLGFDARGGTDILGALAGRLAAHCR